MPNKTLYVRDEDSPIWEEAERLANGAVSPLVSKLLREFVVENRIDTETGMERIVVEVHRDKYADARKKAFTGRWLIDPEQAVGDDPRFKVAVALTAKGQLAVYEYDERDDLGNLEVYENFDAMKAAESDPVHREPKYSGEVLAEVATALNQDYEEELDI